MRANDEGFWIDCEPIIKKALDEVAAVAPDDTVSKALSALLNRVTSSVHTLLVIADSAKNHPNRFHNLDACAILRCCYDAFLQAAYIAHDPAKAPDLANDYLDFYYIERHKACELLQSSNARALKDRINNSPKRAQAEPLILAAFDRVHRRFIKSAKPIRYYKSWYERTIQNLRDIALKTGWEDEYKIIHCAQHSSVHSGFYAINTKGGFVFDNICFQAQMLVFRIVKRIGSVHGVTFKDKEVIELLSSADESILK